MYVNVYYKTCKAWITLEAGSFDAFHQLKYPYFPTSEQNSYIITHKSNQKNGESRIKLNGIILTIKICTKIVKTTDTQLSIKTNLPMMITFLCVSILRFPHIPRKKIRTKNQTNKFPPSNSTKISRIPRCTTNLLLKTCTWKQRSTGTWLSKGNG